MIWVRKSCCLWQRVNLTIFAVVGRGPCLFSCRDTRRIWNACGRDLGKHIAFYHIELAQLWRCPIMWCTVWKGTAQDCIDHMRRVHKVPLSVKAANLATYFPPWTVTRERWADMMMPSISRAHIYIGCVSSSKNQTPRWCAGSIASLCRS